VAAEFLGVASAGTGAQATIRRRGTSGRETVDIARVYDCGGVSVNVETSSNAVVRDLVGRGIARPDALHIGLDVSPDCQLVDRDGSPSVDLLAVGPLTRGQFFEIEAIPDIRIQCAKVAERLLSL
jgi:uncharacterized NAD(P)/FAD-binding protein YdhS